MIPLDQLMKPIAADDPCGEDLSADGSLLQLEALIKPVLDAEEVEIEPEWRKVREEALSLLGRSKDLRVATILCLALLKLEGLKGFRDGLALVHGWVGQYWDSLFPRLDEDDPTDPTRVFALNNLSAALATETPYKFVKCLRLVPLCQPAHLRGCCLRDIVQAQAQSGAAESATESGKAADPIGAAFRDTPTERLQGVCDLIQAVQKAVADLEETATNKSGGGQGPNFDLLKETLQAMANEVSRFLPSAATEVAVDEAGPKPTTAGKPAESSLQPGFMPGGSIRSRAEAEAALRAAADYFRRQEPSSAAPLLIERALRLLGKDFLDTLAELQVEVESKKLFGVDRQAEAAGSSSAGGETS